MLNIGCAIIRKYKERYSELCGEVFNVGCAIIRKYKERYSGSEGVKSEGVKSEGVRCEQAYLMSMSLSWGNSQCFLFSTSMNPHLVCRPSTFLPPTVTSRSLPITANGMYC